MDIHLAGADFNGTIWHALRSADGVWTPPGNVTTVVGNPGSCFDVHISADVDELHLVSHTTGFFGGGQTIWLATRHADGSWSPFINLNNVFGNPGGTIGFQGDALAMVGNPRELHLGALTSDIWGINGTIWHAIRHADTTWTPLGNVNQVVGHAGSFSQVALAEVAGELHLAGLDGSTIWHAIRHVDGSWTQFGNVNKVVGSPGGGYVWVALAGVNNELQLVGVDGQGMSWHAIRHVDGSWTPFGDVMGAVGSPGTHLFSVALGATEDPIQLFLVGIGVGGTLMHTNRNADGTWTALENLSEILGGGPFRSVSVTGAP